MNPSGDGPVGPEPGVESVQVEPVRSGPAGAAAYVKDQLIARGTEHLHAVDNDVGQWMIAGLPVGHITDLAVGLGCRGPPLDGSDLNDEGVSTAAFGSRICRRQHTEARPRLTLA